MQLCNLEMLSTFHIWCHSSHGTNHILLRKISLHFADTVALIAFQTSLENFHEVNNQSTINACLQTFTPSILISSPLQPPMFHFRHPHQLWTTSNPKNLPGMMWQTHFNPHLSQIAPPQILLHSLQPFLASSPLSASNYRSVTNVTRSVRIRWRLECGIEENNC